MKISVNDELLFDFSEMKKKVIENDIPSEMLENDLKRRMHYILNHKYERCLERLKKEWEPKLKQRYASLPTNESELCTLIFSQPDYMKRSERLNREEKEYVRVEAEKLATAISNLKQLV